MYSTTVISTDNLVVGSNRTGEQARPKRMKPEYPPNPTLLELCCPLPPHPRFPPGPNEDRGHCDHNALVSGSYAATETMTEMPAQSQEPDRPLAAVLREARQPAPRDNLEDDREALELQEIQTREDNELDYSSPSASSEGEYRITRRTTSRPSIRRPPVRRKGLWSKIARFWTHQVTLTVPQKSNRDHFGTRKRKEASKQASSFRHNHQCEKDASSSRSY